MNVLHRELTIVDHRSKVIPGRLFFREVPRAVKSCQMTHPCNRCR